MNYPESSANIINSQNKLVLFLEKKQWVMDISAAQTYFAQHMDTQCITPAISITCYHCGHTLQVSQSVFLLSEEFRYNNTFPKLTFNLSKQITVEIPPHPSIRRNVFMATFTHWHTRTAHAHIHSDFTDHLSAMQAVRRIYAYLWFYWGKLCPSFQLLAPSHSPMGLGGQLVCVKGGVEYRCLFYTPAGVGASCLC